MRLPSKVQVMEVGPRDGFQMERQWIPTEKKIEIVNDLSRLGFKEIQVTSFVHPKAVPNLADADELLARIDRVPGVKYQALVPNLRGMQRALAAKPDRIHLMMSVTESHNRANANRSVEESLKEFEQLVPMALEAGIEPEAGLACVFGCPFEGEVPWERLEWVAKRYQGMGIKGLNLGDTIGVGNPRQVHDICARLLDRFPEMQISLHCHNTRDMALANTVAAMQAGVTRHRRRGWRNGGMPLRPRRHRERGDRGPGEHAPGDGSRDGDRPGRSDRRVEEAARSGTASSG